MEYKKLYKMVLAEDEVGVVVVTKEFLVIHETECYFHYIESFNSYMLSSGLRENNETEVQYARRKKILKKVIKGSFRTVFETKEKAMEHLKFMKRKQINHIERQAKFIKAFLSADNLHNDGNLLVVPNTKDLVNEYFVFD